MDRSVTLGWPLVLAAALGGLFCVASAASTPAASRGEQIYLLGQLTSALPVQAARDGDAPRGAGVACVNCHGRSGLGSYEGNILVPPIIGPYLFREGEVNSRDLDLPHVPGYVPRPYAYSEASLARVLQSGAAPDGRVLSALMPRYALDEESVADLSRYLQALSRGPFPGVTRGQIEVATIVSPDADPVERDAMLRVLDAYFALRNAGVAAHVQGDLPTAAAEYRAARLWRLHVWTLTGDSAGWAGQLKRFQQASPVFAVVSGIGRSTWEPIDRFCERQHVPCVFPNVDLPPDAVGGDYALYFSRGVLLEGDLVMRRLDSSRILEKPPRLVQVYRADDIGQAAARALAATARQRGVAVIDRAIRPKASVTSALVGVLPSDVLILWLRPADLRDLGSRVPTRRVFLSASMADPAIESIPVAWRGVARLMFPYDTPQSRAVRENYPHAWFQQHGIAIVSDRVQSNTYLACGILAEAMDGMLDSFVPDFLVERIRGMVSSQIKTGFFPRLGLAAGQQFASKGGYIAKFTGADASQVANDGEWMVP